MEMMSRLQRCADRFAALGQAVRLELVRQLLRAHPTGMVAGALQPAVDEPASTLSHHLDALARAGQIEQEREGRFLRYRVSEPALRDLLGFMMKECCTL
ncbi:MAG TPA: helix-turn-helix domain-containing protein [Kofleriaceae bacterium]|nr:helix-turn-helix domain-containing protein [Kofleriaceae bacterium]